MESISIASFIAFLIMSTAGAWWHYRKVLKSKRHIGTLWDYLIADYPGRSGAVGIALVGASWAAATGGTADFINPELVWTMLLAGKLHIPSVTIAAMAFGTGYMFDSQLNKGGAE
ncbi:MAG: hypothetical protein AABY01_01080 [Nanoarchaeota archaeon]